MNNNDTPPADNYPLAQTEATRMLAAGLECLKETKGKTQRDVARQLGYKTSVVLSHMALGRVPIPIDKANLIADVLKLDPSAFLLAILKQRHPDVKFETLLGVQLPRESATVAELELIAEAPLDELPDETKQLLREVVGSRHPERRWLSTAELPIIEKLRQRYPAMHWDGLGEEDRRQLASFLNARSGQNQ